MGLEPFLETRQKFDNLRGSLVLELFLKLYEISLDKMNLFGLVSHEHWGDRNIKNLIRNPAIRSH
jgi:hypothetical protein